jgi:hypothetical protein
VTLTVRPTRLVTVGNRVFSVAASRLRNSLPTYLTSATTLLIFRIRLKTHLFARSFPDYFFPTLVRSSLAVYLAVSHFKRINVMYVEIFLSTVFVHVIHSSFPGTTYFSLNLDTICIVMYGKLLVDFLASVQRLGVIYTFNFLCLSYSHVN